MNRTVDGASIALPTLRFVHGDPFIEIEMKLVMAVCGQVMLFLGVIGYGIHHTTRLGPSCKKACLAVFPPLFIIAPFLLLHFWGSFRAKGTQFALATVGSTCFFRWLELLCGTGPKGFDQTLWNWMFYFCSPVEVEFDDDGKLAKSEPGLMKHLLLSFVGHAFLFFAVLSLGRSTGLSPFLGGVGIKPYTLPLFGLPWSMPAIYSQIVFAYCQLSMLMILGRIPLTMLGISTVQPMRGPLWNSSSIRDFWGRRWNLIIHKLMKRTYFTPLLKRGCPRCGGLLAFIMSALLHEHQNAMLSWPCRAGECFPGFAIVFFCIQFALTAVEAALEKTALGRWASRWPHIVKILGITFTSMPFTPWFMAPLQDMFVDSSSWMHTVELDWSAEGRSSIVDFQWRYPPLEWVFVASVAVVCLVQAIWSKLSSSWQNSKEQTMKKQQ